MQQITLSTVSLAFPGINHGKARFRAGALARLRRVEVTARRIPLRPPARLGEAPKARPDRLGGSRRRPRFVSCASGAKMRLEAPDAVFCASGASKVSLERVVPGPRLVQSPAQWPDTARPCMAGMPCRVRGGHRRCVCVCVCGGGSCFETESKLTPAKRWRRR